MTAKIFASLFFLLFLLIETVQSQQYSRIEMLVNPITINNFAENGINLDEAIIKGNQLILELSSDELKLIQDLKIPFTVLIPNLTQFYNDRNEGKSISQILEKAKSSDDYPIPQDFSLGSMGGYYTYEETLSQLDFIAQQYPDLVKAREIINGGLTHEGRNLYWLKLSDNPQVDEDEPEVLFTGLIHAREPISISLLIYFMYYLLENYDTDPEIQYLLNHHELYFVPCINPDGYKYNQTSFPSGGGMWRKNRRNNGNGYYGVDLNRNFGYMWGYDNTGSSPTPGSDTYRGPSAFSEPEAQLIRNFCNEHQFKLCMNYHSYSNYLLYPWGYINSASPDELLLKTNAQIMTAENGYSTGRPGQLLYTTNGDANDWMYGEQTTKSKILAYVPEVGNSEDAFWPAIDRIIPLCQENVYPNLMAVKLAGTFSSLSYINNTATDLHSYNFGFSISRLGATPANYNVWLEPITSNIAGVGNPVTFNGMTLPETRQGSISIQLKNCILQGEEIRFRICRSDGFYTWKEEVVQFFGQKTEMFSDPCTNLLNWTPGSWGISTQKFVSSPSSITDSPTGTYLDNQVNVITTSNSIDLTQYVGAEISFKAQWNIEPSWDFVQISVSIDGLLYTPLKGKYTKNGSESQAPGEPVYDGTQSSWITENIDISQFCGNEIKIRFMLKSDGSVTYDGFYFDDLKIIAVDAQNEQQITIPGGWSGISGFLIPQNPDLNLVLGSILPYLVLLQNPDGIFWPSNGINTLQNWTNSPGYMIKTTEPVQLNITGIPDNHKSLILSAGWNLMPVICPCGISSVHLADQSSSHLKLIIEVAGNKIYWPAMGIYTLQTLNQGKSYFVFSDEEVVIENLYCD